VRCYRQVRDGQSMERAEAQHQARGLHYHHDVDGTLVITARFSPEQGEVVLKALQVAMDAFDADACEGECGWLVLAGSGLSPAGFLQEVSIFSYPFFRFPPPGFAWRTFRGDFEHLCEEHATRGLVIDHRTCESAWDGYDMDYSDAICGLLSADGLPV